jgi:bacteriocin biosynthesis cyclodehydratase domain-containing protein
VHAGKEIVIANGEPQLNGGRVLSSGTRMIERAGVLHFYNGRRLVSLDTDVQLRSAIAAITGLTAIPADLTELAAQLNIDPSTTEQLVGLMRSNGLLKLDTAILSDESSMTTDFLGGLVAGEMDAEQADGRLTATTVHVLGATPGALCDALQANGLRATPSSMAVLREADPNTTLVVAESATAHRTTESDLCAVNRFNLDRGLSWLPIGAYDGELIRVGPLIIPNQTACFDCTVTRLAANVEYSAHYRDVVLAMAAASAPAAVHTWAHSVAALSLLRWVGTRDASVPGTMHTLVPRELSIRAATVFRVPRCPTCQARDFIPAAAPWETAGAQ